MKRKKIKEYPIEAENPFPIEDFTFRDGSKTFNKKKLVDPETGEYKELSDIQFQGKVKHDPATYIKVFFKGLEEEDKLSDRGKHLLAWVKRSLKPNQHEVSVRQSEVLKDCPKLKGDGFYIALSDLLENKFLARGGKGMFYINANYYFNGDRRKIKNGLQNK